MASKFLRRALILVLASVVLRRGDAVGEWNLDRIDQRDLPLDGARPVYLGDGSGVHIYIIDTGIRTSHEELTGRIGNGYDAFTQTQTNNSQDCRNHGTGIAAVAAGKTYGVAPGATIHNIKAIDCQSQSVLEPPAQPVADFDTIPTAQPGSISRFIRAFDWVVANHTKPAVINFSGASPGVSTSLKTAVIRAYDAGITVVASAGGETIEYPKRACDHSPAFMPEVITVAASLKNDTRFGSTFFGSCVDIFAPGNLNDTASNAGDDQYVRGYGTSYATAHVAGAAAILLGTDGDMSPSDVKAELIRLSTRDKIQMNANLRSTPNRLLFIGGGCADGWSFYHGYCYRYFGHGADWTDARVFCQNIAADLVSIHSEDENDFIKTLTNERLVCIT